MITPRLRPPLRMTVDVPPAELAQRVEERLADPDASCRGLATGHQIDLRIREADRRFWSPQLTVLVEPAAGGGSALTGHFGPNGNVWTMFMAAHATVVLSAVIGAGVGFAQITIGERGWPIAIVPVAVVLVVLIYVAAGIGQRLGRDQVEVLHRFLENAAGGAGDGVRDPGVRR